MKTSGNKIYKLVHLILFSMISEKAVHTALRRLRTMNEDLVGDFYAKTYFSDEVGQIMMYFAERKYSRERAKEELANLLPTSTLPYTQNPSD